MLILLLSKKSIKTKPLLKSFLIVIEILVAENVLIFVYLFSVARYRRISEITEKKIE
jgi:hypothetical protein